MNKKICKNKFWLIAGISLMFALSCSNAFARDRGERTQWHGREIVTVGHQRYNYHDGRFYRPGWFGFELIINTSPVGAIVTNIPFGCRTIIVGGVSYYNYNNIYYRRCPSGYIVVSGPVITNNVISSSIVAQPQLSYGETVTINVLNSNGSYTPVRLVKSNNGYMGPQGEYYLGNPTVDQLRVLYGR